MKKRMLVLLSAALILPSIAFANVTDNAVYKAKCSTCHGDDAAGQPEMKVPSLKAASAKSPAALTKAIENGSPNTTPKMPTFKAKLTADEIKSLVDGIRSLK
jgi:mono/diheme cytochrome c family protein